MKELIEEAKVLSAGGFVSITAVKKNTSIPADHSTLSKRIVINLNDEDDVDYLCRRLGPFTPIQRSCYVFHHLCGMPIKDVAKRLKVTVPRVESQLEFIKYVF